MKVKLIFILIIVLIIQINSDIIKELNHSISSINNSDIIISSNIKDSIVNTSFENEEINISNFENNINYFFLNNKKDPDINEVKTMNYYYFNFEYLEKANRTINITIIIDKEITKEVLFKEVNFTKSYLNFNIKYILSLKELSDSINDTLISLDYIYNYLNISKNTNKLEKSQLLSPQNLCYNNSLETIINKRFICKLDYILFGHEDLKKDDVYLAKEIDEDYSLAYIDNILSYNIFPDIYFEYFFTSFFSELNDGCQKNEFKLDDYENAFYYITCPKKKIEIYTKRRKLSVIINKFSYKITDLFGDSLEFLDKNNSEDRYYFNIVFERDKKDFTLGKGFIKNKIISFYNECTYIYTEDRDNYTEDLTDINSAQFEKWLYILTTFSFTFLLLIFTIIGCIHSRKVNKELKEMLK